MDNPLPLQVEGLGFDSCQVKHFCFFVVVLFCFAYFLENHIGGVLQLNLLGINVTFDSNPK